MKLDHNTFGALRAKSRSLRRKNDSTRIQASSAVACDGSIVSPKNSHFGHSSHEDLHAPHGASRASSVDNFGPHHHMHLHHHHSDFATNSPILLDGDKELHDPNFVRHNWEMMSGESTLPDKQLHIGRSASPRLTSRRSTLSSRTGSSRPSSRGSEAGGHHTSTFGLGVNAFSGLASYSQAGSVGRASGARSSSTRGLQVEGSILRDEEAILYSDDDSSDEEDDDEYSSNRHHDMFPGSEYRLPTSRRTSPVPRITPPSPRSLATPSIPSSPVLAHASATSAADKEGSTAAAASAAFHRRRHWTVAEGSQASNGGLANHGLHGRLPTHGQVSAIKERSLSQPA